MKHIKSFIFSFVILSSLATVGQGEDLYNAGTDLYFQGDYEAALNYLDSAIALNSDDISRFFFRSKIKEKMGRIRGAISDLTECINRSTSDVLYLNIRADYYQRVGSTDLALEDYNESLKLKKTWQAFHRRGLIYAGRKLLKKALSDFNEAAKLAPTQAAPIQARALAKFELGDKTGACDDMYTVFDMGFTDVRDWIRRNCG